MSSSWSVEDDAPRGREVELSPFDGTVSLAYLRSTLRRVWYAWVGSALLGLALAGAWLALVAPPSVGTVTLLLAHDKATEADEAMATDVRLLTTRAVAQELTDQLGSEETPDDLLETVVAEPATSSVLKVDVRGSDPDDAVRRARLLAATFLDYRERQLTQESDAVTDGYQDRIDALQVQVDDLTSQYDLVVARGGGDEEAAGVLALRGQLMSEITRLGNEIEAERLDSNAIVVASRVLDEASLVPRSTLRRTGLGLGSGLVGGLGLGLGLVVVYSITTGRLRSRADVAAAMGVPVAYSAGRILPRRRRPGARHEAAAGLLVDGLERVVPKRKPRRLALVTVDCEREGAAVLTALASRLGADPAVSVSVMSGPAPDTVADVVLTLVPFDVGRGLTHVRPRASRCVVLVKAGRSTAERLSTVARSAASAGLRVEFVMLVGADGSDQSFGGEYAVDQAQPTR